MFAADAWGTAKYETLYEFGKSFVGGLNPFSGVTLDKAGNIYGTTNIGGIYDRGTVYELSPSASGLTEKVLFNFGAFYASNSAPLLDPVGNLYGVAAEGGKYNYGAVFELTPNRDGSWTATDIHDFGGYEEHPEGSLIMDSSGNLYGTTYSNPGSVFELSRVGKVWKERVLYNFGASANDGANPWGALTFDAAGNLFGTTTAGGTSNLGTVFELSPSSNSWRETLLYSFQGGSDGSFPYSNVIFDPAGNLYGTTEEGGPNNLGTVFELSPSANGWTERVIHSFSGLDGEIPVSGLVLFGESLYGSASLGLNSGGTVFALTPNSNDEWGLTVLHTFSGPYGGDYPSGLVADSAGDLYGSNPYAYSDGAVFEVIP
jgi:uncharacterized repeat protein (TIGR03803 family)